MSFKIKTNRVPRALFWMLLLGSCLICSFAYITDASAQDQTVSITTGEKQPTVKTTPKPKKKLANASGGDTYNFYFQKSGGGPITTQESNDKNVGQTPKAPSNEETFETVTVPKQPEIVPAPSQTPQDAKKAQELFKMKEAATTTQSKYIIEDPVEDFHPVELSLLSMWGLGGGSSSFFSSFGSSESYSGYSSNQSFILTAGLRFSERVGLNFEYDRLAYTYSNYSPSDDDFGFGSTTYSSRNAEILSALIDLVPIRGNIFGNELSLSFLAGAGYDASASYNFGGRLVPVVGAEVDFNVIDQFYVKVGLRHFFENGAGRNLTGTFLGAGLGIRL